MSRLSDLLSSGPHAIDGGLASELEARGYDLAGSLWSARLLRDDPDAIRAVHQTYFEAGATVGISASYQASRPGFIAAGLSPDEADRLLALSVELVAQARDRARANGVTHPMLVAASVGPWGATMHDGSEYRGRYGKSHDFLVDFHRERTAVLVAASPDLLAIETIPDLDEALALVDVMVDVDVPAWLSFSCESQSHTCAGQPIEAAAELVATHFDAIGINCTKPEFVSGLITRIRAVAPELPIVVYPNAGRVWDGDASVWLGEGTDLLPRAAVADWVTDGATLIGGCCGLGPAAITEIADITKQELL